MDGSSVTEPNIVSIGGTKYVLPPMLTFDRLKLAWPAVEAFGDPAAKLVGRVSSACRLISIALLHTNPELTPIAIEMQLKIHLFDGSGEMTSIIDAAHRLMIDSGLWQPAPEGEQAVPGEAMGAMTTTNQNSMEISPP